MKILVVLLYFLCLILCSANVEEEALGSGDGDYSLDDDTEEGEDEQYDYSQNKTETRDNDDEYNDVYYEIIEQDDDIEEGEDKQYDFSQNMTETRDNDDEYYEIVEQTETNRFYFLPSSYPPTKKNIFILNYFFPAHREVPGGKRTRHGTPLPRLGLKTGIFFKNVPFPIIFLLFPVLVMWTTD